MQRLAVLLLLVLLSAACGSGGGERTPDSQPAGVDLVESSHPPDIQCLLDHGWTLEDSDGESFWAVSAPGGLETQERERVERTCDELRPKPIMETDEEVRQIYERWLAEADCLRELGYSPDPAPPFEVFLADWRGPGPWFPIDGVDTGAWTLEQYEEAKEMCVLEAFTSDFSPLRQ